MDITKHAEFYRDKLLDDVLPLWLAHSPDREYGGYFTCLDRKWNVYDTDKFMWPHGRQVWMLSKMYRHVRKEAEYLDVARLGAEFIRDHGFDENGKVYFALDRAGQAYAGHCIFSDCFCAMGLAEYAAAADAPWARDLAMKTYQGIQNWLVNKEYSSSRLVPGVRPMESMVFDMINVNMSLELASTIDDPVFRKCGLASADKILDLHVDRKEGLFFEHVSPDGSHPDTFAGRLINPGHALECMWFLISAGETWGRDDLADAAVDAMGDMLEFGWDKQYGGFFAFMDARGKPPEQLEWDQKLWWVQGESLIALLMAYRHSGKDKFAQWFEKFHDYCWGCFPDRKYGEWLGYRKRDGQVLLDLKGGKWKGCFHLPRALWLCWRILENLPDVKQG